MSARNSVWLRPLDTSEYVPRALPPPVGVTDIVAPAVFVGTQRMLTWLPGTVCASAPTAMAHMAIIQSIFLMLKGVLVAGLNWTAQ